MIFDGFSHQLPDTDPQETKEWLESFDQVVDAEGKSRGRFLLMKLLERARELQVGFPATVSTPYINTIPPNSSHGSQATNTPSGGFGRSSVGTRP